MTAVTAAGAGAGAGAVRPVVCLLERDGDEIADGSLRALTLSRSLADAVGGGLTAVLFALPGREDAGAGPEAGDFAAGFASPAAADPAGEAVVAAVAARGASELCVVSAAGAGGYAPLAWARALEQVAAGGGAAAVIAAATDHGSEVLAHLGALTGLPVAANCVAVAPDEPGHWRLTRQRWAGQPARGRGARRLVRAAHRSCRRDRGCRRLR